MRPPASYLRSLDPGLSRAVWTLQLGGFANAFGNGMVFAASVGAGVGNGAFWPASSSLLAALTEHETRHSAAGGCRSALRDRIFIPFLVLDAFFVAAGFACQLPIAKLLEGRRRMAAYAVEAAA